MFIKIIVCDLFSWKNTKKTGMIFACVNMYFLLITVLHYQILSLLSLFLFFVSIIGMALNLVYRASND